MAFKNIKLPEIDFSRIDRRNITREEALEIASECHLENEIQACMDAGMSPDEALCEWDL